MFVQRILTQKILDKVAEEVQLTVKQPKELIQIVVTWQDEYYYEANKAMNYDKLQYKTGFTSYLISGWNEILKKFSDRLKQSVNVLQRYLKNPADIEFAKQIIINPTENLGFISDIFKSNFKDQASIESLLQKIRQNASSNNFQQYPQGQGNNIPMNGGYNNQRNNNITSNPQGHQTQEQVPSGMQVQQQLQQTTTMQSQQRYPQNSIQQQQQQPQMSQSQLQQQYNQQQYTQQGESQSSLGVNKSSGVQFINKQKYHETNQTFSLK